MRRAFRSSARLLPAIDGAELIEQWIEPDPWSWCYHRPRPKVVWTA